MSAIETTRPADSGRARLPDRSGFAVADDGVRIAWEAFGSGDPTIVFRPSANHMIPGGHPLLANLLIRDFVRGLGGTR